MDSVLKSLLSLLSTEERKEVKKIIQSEQLNCMSLTNDKDRVDTIWLFS